MSLPGLIARTLSGPNSNAAGIERGSKLVGPIDILLTPEHILLKLSLGISDSIEWADDTSASTFSGLIVKLVGDVASIAGIHKAAQIITLEHEDYAPPHKGSTTFDVDLDFLLVTNGENIGGIADGRICDRGSGSPSVGNKNAKEGETEL